MPGKYKIQSSVLKAHRLLLWWFLIPITFLCAKGISARQADSLLFLLKRDKIADTARIRRLYSLSICLRGSNADTAWILAEQSLTLAKQLKFIPGEAAATHALGFCYEARNEPDSAALFYKRALTLWRELKNDYGEACVLANYSRVFSGKGEQREALRMLKEAYAIFSLYRNEQKMATVLNSIGLLYVEMDELDQGLDYLLRAKLFYEKTGDRLSVASVSFNCSIAYQKLHDPGRAKTYALMALKIIDAYGEKAWKGVVRNELGNIYMLEKNYAEALRWYKEAAVQAREMNNKASLFLRLTNTGAVYSLMKDHSNAVRYYREAYAIDRATIAPGSMASLANNISISYLELGRKDSAVFFGRQAMDLAQQLNSKSLLYNACISLSHALKAKNSMTEAFGYMERAFGLKDSVLDENKAQRIAKLEAGYETAKKEQEIALLQVKNLEVQALAESRKYSMMLIISISTLLLLLIILILFRSRALKKQREVEFERSRAELEQKALRAQMNPHFIFNGLNSIQRMYVEGKVEEANDLMADFSNLLRRILDNSNKNQITLKEELDTLCLYLEIEKVRCNGQFSYSIHIDETIDLYVSKIPPLVIQPFVENAIWHGILPKKSAGNISVTLTDAKNGQLRCTVEDDGVGLRKTSTSLHEPKGISITESRLSTKVSLQSVETGGTRISFLIPSYI